MIVYSHNGKCIEIKRNDYYTDADYFIAIINIKYGESLPRYNMTVDELCEMI
jgi:hypothetical protein